MFKKLILATLCSATVMSGAQAADSVDLKVTGTLVNGACTPSLENGGVVDFGHIPLGNLSKTGINQLGSKTQTLTITCDSEMPVAWAIVDNKKDTLANIEVDNAWFNGGNATASGNQFGLGETSAGVKIGAYTVGIDGSKTTVDGANGDLIRHDTNQEPWVNSDSGATQTFGRNETIAAKGSLEPLAGKVFVYPLKVTAAIQGTDTLAVTDDTQLDGSATISVVYI